MAVLSDASVRPMIPSTAGPDKSLLMDPHDCPFCRPEPTRIREESAFAAALLDAFPVTPGHTLVIPKRHVASLFDLPDEEQAAVWRLVGQVRAQLLTEL